MPPSENSGRHKLPVDVKIELIERDLAFFQQQMARDLVDFRRDYTRRIEEVLETIESLKSMPGKVEKRLAGIEELLKERRSEEEKTPVHHIHKEPSTRIGKWYRESKELVHDTILVITVLSAIGSSILHWSASKNAQAVIKVLDAASTAVKPEK